MAGGVPGIYGAEREETHPLGLSDPGMVCAQTASYRDDWLGDPLMQGGTVSPIWEETKAGLDELLKKHGYIRRGGIYLCENNTDETIVIFCHFGIGMAILAHLINLSPLLLWQGFLCVPSAVTTVVTQERKKGEVEFRCVGLEIGRAHV